MGGDYEDKVEVASPKDEVTISGIRMHTQAGHRHFHNDKEKLKCYVPLALLFGGWQKIMNPVDTETFTHKDVNNKSKLTIKTTNKKGKINTFMSVEPYNPPNNFDKTWHVLNDFLNKGK
jgi:hypothetical protein